LEGQEEKWYGKASGVFLGINGIVERALVVIVFKIQKQVVIDGQRT
jgi:hypothetical protein